MAIEAPGRKVLLTMYARAVDDADSRLRELRHDEWERLGLGGLALGLAVVAAEVRPSLALPLFLGGLVVGVLGVTALWRRWDLVDRLAGERDAYVIPEVLAHALREATMERRHDFAVRIRGTLRGPVTPGLATAAEELEVLASELDDGELALDPACAVACMRLLSDPAESPLFNPMLPPDELRSRVRQIRAGFSSRRLAA